MLTKVYAGLWNKYRPAILRMMVDADGEPQRYQLSAHEFVAFNNGKKATFNFSMDVSNGKVISGMKDSPVAQDLWEVLSYSPKASELLSSAATYRFTLDKQCVLLVQKNNNEN